MREKPAQTQAIQRTVNFLKNLNYKCAMGENFSLTALILESNIARGTSVAVIELNIIKKVNKNSYQWIKPGIDSFEDWRNLALEVKNNLLSKTKKTIHTPIAGFEDLVTHVKRLVDKMDIHITQSEVVLKRFKQANNETETSSETLFSQEQQKSNESFQLLLAVTTGHYGNYDYLTPFDQINDRIINSHKDLFTKYINLKSNKNERTKQFKNQEENQDDKLLTEG